MVPVRQLFIVEQGADVAEQAAILRQVAQADRDKLRRVLERAASLEKVAYMVYQRDEEWRWGHRNPQGTPIGAWSGAAPQW